jgi:hypothetical protein
MSTQKSVSHIISLALLGIGLSTLALDALAPRAMSIGGVPMRSIRERGLDQGKES